jgi:hypothetical protein
MPDVLVHGDGGFCSFVFPRRKVLVCKCLILWSGLSESNRHLNLGKVREVKSNALERRHLTILGRVSIGK